MKSALADSPHFRAYQLRLGLAVVCRYLTASSPCYRAGAAGVLSRRHDVEFLSLHIHLGFIHQISIPGPKRRRGRPPAAAVRRVCTDFESPLTLDAWP